MQVSDETIREIEEAFSKNELEIKSSKMKPTTKKTYLLHTQNFVRWLRGEFAPGATKD